MNITVGVNGISSVTNMLRATPKQLTIARARAIRKTLAKIKTIVKRDAAKELKIVQKAITKRLRTSTVRNTDTSGKLWAGTWNLSPFSLGVPSSSLKTRVIQAGNRRYPGAFMKRMFGGAQPEIWMRLNSPNYRSELYPTKHAKVGASSLPANLRHKFPVAKAAIIVEPAMATVFARDEAEIIAQFNLIMQRELNYALNVEGKN